MPSQETAHKYGLSFTKFCELTDDPGPQAEVVEFRKRRLQSIKTSLGKFPTAQYVCVFVNQMLDSSQLGQMTFMVCGPDNTYKDPDECVGVHLNDLPSQRQQFTGYITVEELKPYLP